MTVQCADGVDNADAEDTLVDSADPGCHTDGNASNSASYSVSDNDESNASSCQNGVTESPEQCDDGNAVNGDFCDSSCRIEVCGNGFVQSGETCDDGNLVNGDGCSAVCQTEAPSSVVQCNGLPATIFVGNGIIVGGPQNGKTFWGTLNGTNGDDVIVTTDNPDTVYGLGGNDVICSLGGPDRVLGGAGDDWIDGGAGPDRINGNDGKDFLIGGLGLDSVYGDADSDTLCTGDDGDLGDGGAGNDLIDGAAGGDNLKGGIGTDACHRGEIHNACESIIASPLPVCVGF
ncbi:MAG: DUF4215 domain-containing protein, partial [Candidatus Peribacteraceae bacterium]|nr:DUF4215 domain-containing protein [Candidatus Peribacteraceae bacterium]